MGMFHFSVEYYGVATRTDSLKGVLQNFKQHLRVFARSCSVTEQCLITSSEINASTELSDNRFTEKQRMTISPNSSNVSCKQLLNTWRKSSDSPSATLFYSWIVWGLNSRWVWLLWHHTHPRAEKTLTAPGTASTETTGLPIKIKQSAPAGWLKETSMFLCTADGTVDRF